MTAEPQGIINPKKMPGAILLSLVLFVALFSVSGGGGPEAQMFQSGFVDIPIAAGGTGGGATITFNPAFAQTPTVAMTIKPQIFGSQFETEKVFLLNPAGTSFAVTTALTQVGTLSAEDTSTSPEPLIADLYADIGTVSSANQVQIFIQSFDCTRNSFENASSDGLPPIAFTNTDANSLLMLEFQFNTTLWNIIRSNGCVGNPNSSTPAMSFRLMMNTVSGTNTVLLRKVALMETFDVPVQSAFIVQLSSSQMQIEATSPASVADQTIRVYWSAYVCLDGSSAC